MINPESGDPTPVVGSQTDMAPLGRSGEKPPHERTADEERDGIPWDTIAAYPGFKELLGAKASFVVPATIFFLLYYFALLLLVGWFPDLMKKEVGGVNLAYWFALSQFFMAWIVAGLYVAKAAAWDKAAANLIAKFKKN